MGESVRNVVPNIKIHLRPSNCPHYWN